MCPGNSERAARFSFIAFIARISLVVVINGRGVGYSPVCMNDETYNDETDAELKRLRQRNEELEAELRMRGAREQMTAELTAAGARSPLLLFETVSGEIEFAEDGKPANVSELVADLRKRLPEQFGRDSAAASVNAGAGAAASPNPLTADALAKMSPAEIAKLDWTAVREVLANTK